MSDFFYDIFFSNQARNPFKQTGERRHSLWELCPDKTECYVVLSWLTGWECRVPLLFTLKPKSWLELIKLISWQNCKRQHLRTHCLISDIIHKSYIAEGVSPFCWEWIGHVFCTVHNYEQTQQENYLSVPKWLFGWGMLRLFCQEIVYKCTRPSANKIWDSFG